MSYTRGSRCRRRAVRVEGNAGPAPVLGGRTDAPADSLGRIATKLVIVLRADLPMSGGKAAAQAAHAAVGAVLAQLRSPSLAVWLDEGQPTVVLRVDSGASLDDVVATAARRGLPVCPIADAGRTQLPAGTLTCCAMGPADAAAIDAVTGDLPLY